MFCGILFSELVIDFSLVFRYFSLPKKFSWQVEWWERWWVYQGLAFCFHRKCMVRKQWQRYMYCPAQINYVMWSISFVGSIGAVALLHSSPAVSQNLCHMIKRTVCHICTWYWAVNTHICSLMEILVVLGIWKMWKLRRVGRELVFVSYCNVQQHKDGQQDMPIAAG